LVTAAAEFRVINFVAQHDPQPDAQLAGYRDARFPHSFLHQLPAIETPQFRVAANRVYRRFSPKETQQGVALLANPSESLTAPAGVFAGNHPDVTGYRFAVSEALRITKKHLGGQSGERSYTGMSHQSERLWPLLCFSLDLAVQIVDRTLQLWIQRQQGVALRAG